MEIDAKIACRGMHPMGQNKVGGDVVDQGRCGLVSVLKTGICCAKMEDTLKNYHLNEGLI